MVSRRFSSAVSTAVVPPADAAHSSAVTVIVPLHDHGDVIAETLESILSQDHPPVEVVVIDDGSEDGGGDIAAAFSPRVRVIRQPQAGVSRARNRGLAETEGELVVFFDADDLMPAGRLRRQVAELEGDPDLDGLFGDVIEFRPDTGWRSEPQPGRLPGSFMLRRSALDRVGGFREGGAQVEAVEWAARAADAGLDLRYVPGVTMERRLHAGNHSRATDPREYLRVLKTIMDRRRSDSIGT